MPEQGQPAMWQYGPPSGSGPATYTGELKEPKQYEHLRGRDLFDKLTISALNHTVVMELVTWTVDEAELTWPSTGTPGVNMGEPLTWELSDLAERAYVEGAQVTLDTEDEGLIFLPYLLDVTLKRVVQRVTECEPRDFFNVANEQTVVRVFNKQGEVWTVTDYIAWGTDKQLELTRPEDYERLKCKPFAPNPVPAADFRVYPWGRGVLEPVGYLLQFIERMFLRMDQYTDPSNNAIHVIGANDDRSVAATTAGIRDKTRQFFWPLGTQLTRLADGTLPTVMLAQLEQALPFVRDAIGVVKISETVQLSGVSRKMAMRSMLALIRKVRQWLKAFIEEWGGSVTFPAITVTDLAEMVEQYHWYKELKADGVMGAAEFMEQSRELASLPEELPDDLEEEEPPPVVLPQQAGALSGVAAANAEADAAQERERE